MKMLNYFQRQCSCDEKWWEISQCLKFKFFTIVKFLKPFSVLTEYGTRLSCWRTRLSLNRVWLDPNWFVPGGSGPANVKSAEDILCKKLLAQNYDKLDIITRRDIAPDSDIFVAYAPVPGWIRELEKQC